MIVITLNKYTVKVKVIFLFCLLGISCMLKAADKPIIKIETDCTSLIFQVGDNGRLYQRYLGKKLNHESATAIPAIKPPPPIGTITLSTS